MSKASAGRENRAKRHLSPAVQRPYHHGDLHGALLRAGDEELAERGIEAFTLRGCARRAGVSHAAPAHHFRDVTGLLSEMAAIAFEELTESTRSAADGAPAGTVEQLIALASAYVRFAVKHPHQFRLMFRSERLDYRNQRLKTAADAAFQVPIDVVGAYCGCADPMRNPDLSLKVMAIWSMAHGLADLLISTRRVPAFGGGDREKAIEVLVPAIVRQHFAGRR